VVLGSKRKVEGNAACTLQQQQQQQGPRSKRQRGLAGALNRDGLGGLGFSVRAWRGVMMEWLGLLAASKAATRVPRWGWLTGLFMCMADGAVHVHGRRGCSCAAQCNVPQYNVSGVAGEAKAKLIAELVSKGRHACMCLFASLKQQSQQQSWSMHDWSVGCVVYRYRQHQWQLRGFQWRGAVDIYAAQHRSVLVTCDFQEARACQMHLCPLLHCISLG
jgi:hypothetical protein